MKSLSLFFALLPFFVLGQNTKKTLTRVDPINQVVNFTVLNGVDSVSFYHTCGTQVIIETNIWVDHPNPNFLDALHESGRYAVTVEGSNLRTCARKQIPVNFEERVIYKIGVPKNCSLFLK